MKKKLIILGGNPETAVLVGTANNMGVYTIVIDPNPKSPAKLKASKSFDLDVFEIDKIVELGKKLNVDGVLVGVADILVKPYRLICEKLKFPCYVSKNTEEAFCSKDGFNRYCLKYKIQDIPGFLVNKIPNDDELEEMKFPVMIKPVDNGGGVGMKICRDLEHYKDTIKHALKFSKKGTVIVEKYMECDDMAAYYTFKEGVPHLSAISDRFTTKKQGDYSPVCIGAVFPSKYTTQFVQDIHPKLCDFFKKINIENGVLNIQFFVENNVFYAYDPGFRLQGEAPHIPLAFINKFDHREMLINYALTGVFGTNEFENKNDFLFGGKYACTIWVLLNKGKIKSIEGIKRIKSDKNTIFVLERFKTGDIVEPEMLGTEKQVYARIYLVADNILEINEMINDFKNLLKIFDINGKNMIIDWIKPFNINEYN